jgi:hypothetical protein
MIMIFTMLLVTTQVNAQKKLAKSVEPGIKGGVNFSTLNRDLDDNAKTRTSLHLGLFAHIHLSDDFALQPELLFSGQGAKYMTGTEPINSITSMCPYLSSTCLTTDSGWKQVRNLVF